MRDVSESCIDSFQDTRFVAQHVDAEKQSLAEQQLDKALRAEKLATVDCVLWRTNFLEQDSASQETKGKLHTLSPVSPAPSGCITFLALRAICLCWLPGDEW